LLFGCDGGQIRGAEGPPVSDGAPQPDGALSPDSGPAPGPRGDAAPGPPDAHLEDAAPDPGDAPLSDAQTPRDATGPTRDAAPPTRDATAPAQDASAPTPPDAAPRPPDAAPTPPPIPADCPWPVEVVYYTASATRTLANALAAQPGPCAHHYLSVPSVEGNKTIPRPGVAPGLRALSPRVHAMAEFNWGGWADVEGLSWYEKGVEFRRQMPGAGYDVAAGDTWALNELPNAVRRGDPGFRRAARDVVRGLFDGPPGAPPIKGAVFVINMGHRTQNLATYKPQVGDWLQDRAFWEDMNRGVRWWAQEAYVDPHRVCVGGSPLARRDAAVTDFVLHPARLATAAPDAAGVNTAQSFFSRTYLPLMNAGWRSAGGFGDTSIPLAQMKHHVSGQVHAVRAWSDANRYPGGRIGFGWFRSRTEPPAAGELESLAERLASSLRHAYGEPGGVPLGACGRNRENVWCQCNVAGAAFDDVWQAFRRW
jgi:hypothetical protein